MQIKHYARKYIVFCYLSLTFEFDFYIIAIEIIYFLIMFCDVYYYYYDCLNI